jgi:hypothetical protein
MVAETAGLAAALVLGGEAIAPPLAGAGAAVMKGLSEPSIPKLMKRIHSSDMGIQNW